MATLVLAMAALNRFIKGLDLNDVDLSVGLQFSQLGDMTNLEWIRLDRTNLSDIPKEVLRLGKLKKLSLSHNQVRLAAAHLCAQLTHVTLLGLAQIDRLVYDLQELASMEVFKARYNNVLDIADGLFLRWDIRSLNLAHNKLNGIPDELLNAKHLVVLVLKDNGITEVPGDFCLRMRRLERLDLSYNQITVRASLFIARSPGAHTVCRSCHRSFAAWRACVA